MFFKHFYFLSFVLATLVNAWIILPDLIMVDFFQSWLKIAVNALLQIIISAKKLTKYTVNSVPFL